MGAMCYVSNTAISLIMLQQMALQQQLIDTQQQLVESQKQVVALQKKLDRKKPKTPKDEDVFWHIASGGMLSTEAANSQDLITVRKFQEWNIKFAEKYIKPYVDPKVYSECVTQMTRGLPERAASLQTRNELLFMQVGELPSSGNGKTVKSALLKK